MCWRTYRHLRKIASCWTSHKVIELNKGMPKYPVWSLVLVAWVLFALSVVAEGTYDSSYGSTLLVKVQNTSASERRVFVHSGCLVVMLDGNKLRENMENSIIATSRPLGSPCDKNSVNGIGVNTNASFALVSHGTSLSAVYFAQTETVGYPQKDIGDAVDVVVQRIPSLVHREGLNATTNFVGYGRITNGMRDEENNRDLFIAVGLDEQKNGHALIIASSGKGATLSLKIISSLLIGQGVNDIRPYDEQTFPNSPILANYVDGLKVLNYDVNTNMLSIVNQQSITYPDKSSHSDGMDVNPKFAYIAAQGNGLYVYDLNKKAVVGNTDEGLTGWAGGVRVIGNFALVAADPGLIIYDVKDPTKPTLQYTCKMGGSGKGWNLATDKGSNLVFVADNQGGLQIVELVDDGKGTIIGHFGQGVIQNCDG